MNETGTIQVITGEGKGKTTAALGLALRAVDRGLRVFMVQFLKAPHTSGEHFSAEAVAPLLTIKPMGRKGFIRKSGGEARDRLLAQQALQEARTAMLSGDYGVIVLDEINVAVSMGLIDVKDVLEFIDAKPEGMELLLTGRYAQPEIVRRADLVLEMKKIKHPFDQGIPAMEGIEY
ncbi:MAG: cob(I)yrinic acid a,c-diamide adenosyltransferase [Desulfomonile tiedjei]|nr:cob(I)yrinic acid a,c-diamide adenosyltransferase [Desulfomonile tiedjei]